MSAQEKSYHVTLISMRVEARKPRTHARRWGPPVILVQEGKRIPRASSLARPAKEL